VGARQCTHNIVSTRGSHTHLSVQGLLDGVNPCFETVFVVRPQITDFASESTILELIGSVNTSAFSGTDSHNLLDRCRERHFFLLTG
jgi:hypothetical protein